MIEVIHPRDESHWLQCRVFDLTSTEIGALFGVSPYCTEFELWHRKKALEVVALEPNDRIKWGRRLEKTIAEGVAEDQGWQIRHMTEYVRMPARRLGASFDYEIEKCAPRTFLEESPGVWHSDPPKLLERGLLEIKNVDSLAFRNGWAENEDGTLEAPAHIELQVQHQLAVSDRQAAYIAALVGGNRIALIRRERDEKIISAIFAKAAAFWGSIDANTPPAPNFALDLDTISRLYGYAEPGKVVDAREDERIRTLAGVYGQATAMEKQAKSAKDAAKAEMLTLIGSAEKVLGEGFSISAGVVSPAPVAAYERAGYRLFRVNWKAK